MSREKKTWDEVELVLIVCFNKHIFVEIMTVRLVVSVASSWTRSNVSLLNLNMYLAAGVIISVKYTFLIENGKSQDANKVVKIFKTLTAFKQLVVCETKTWLCLLWFKIIKIYRISKSIVYRPFL